MRQLTVVKAQLGLVLGLIAVYFLQAATPLRLHPDTVVLLSVAETAEHGGGYLFHGQPTVFPPGYPTLIAGLMKMNLARVWVIVGLNVLFVVIGLLGVRCILRTEEFSEPSILCVCALSLLSVVFIKYSPMPLTDPLYFAASMCSLAFIKFTSSSFTLRRALTSVGLMVGCICIRRIGIAIIPALLWMLVSQSNVRTLYARKKAASLVGALLIVIALTLVVCFTSTLRDFTVNVPDSLRSHFTELGEITLNLMSGVLPTTVQGFVPAIGIAVLLSIFGGIAWRRKVGVVEIYFGVYAAIVLVWPFYDVRFWLPVVPFLFAYSWLTLRNLIPGHKLVFAAYVFLFSVIGSFTLLANTRITFAGPGFADAYPESRYHSAYCAIRRCAAPDTAKVDQDGLHLLQYYK